jgi:hypothetical protein
MLWIRFLISNSNVHQERNLNHHNVFLIIMMHYLDLNSEDFLHFPQQTDYLNCFLLSIISLLDSMFLLDTKWSSGLWKSPVECKLALWICVTIHNNIVSYNGLFCIPAEEHYLYHIHMPLMNHLIHQMLTDECQIILQYMLLLCIRVYFPP